jgi:hypothetical protein
MSLDALREILCCISVETTKFKIIVHLVQMSSSSGVGAGRCTCQEGAIGSHTAPPRTFPSRMGLGSTYHNAYETEGECFGVP